VMLSYGTWQKRFGARNDLVGQTVILSGEAFTIIGVLPMDFQFAPLGRAEFWTPIDVKGPCAVRRTCHNLNGVARLKDGATIESALANLAAIASNWNSSIRIRTVIGARASCRSPRRWPGITRPILMVLMGGAGLLLLIAYVNVLSLVLARSEARRREMAVRSALGASLSRLFSQFMTEALVLVVGGTVGGLLLANVAMQALKKSDPGGNDVGHALSPGSRFERARGSICGRGGGDGRRVVSLTPALHFALAKTRDGLRKGAAARPDRRGSGLVRGWSWWNCDRDGAARGAGLFAKSLNRLLHVQLGFQADHLVTINVAAPDVRYKEGQQKVALGREIVGKIESIPGVQSAALTTQPPVTYNGNTDWIRIVGKPYDGKAHRR